MEIKAFWYSVPPWGQPDTPPTDVMRMCIPKNPEELEELKRALHHLSGFSVASSTASGISLQDLMREEIMVLAKHCKTGHPADTQH